MTVERMLAEISAKELTEWMAFDTVEPFGGLQDEYRTGMIASTVANTTRDEKKKKEPFTPQDFMRPEFLSEQPVEEDEEVDEEVKQLKLWNRIKAAFAVFPKKEKPDGNPGKTGRKADH